MHALELLAVLVVQIFITLETRKLCISQDLHLEGIPGVLLLLDRPLAVLIIERDPVVVNLLVNIDIADLEGREALVERLLQPIAEVIDKVEHDEGDHQGPLDAIPALVREDGAHSVLSDVSVNG